MTQAAGKAFSFTIGAVLPAIIGAGLLLLTAERRLECHRLGAAFDCDQQLRLFGMALSSEKVSGLTDATVETLGMVGRGARRPAEGVRLSAASGVHYMCRSAVLAGELFPSAQATVRAIKAALSDPTRRSFVVAQVDDEKVLRWVGLGALFVGLGNLPYALAWIIRWARSSSRT
jgi:hypothetical protein